MSELGLTWTGAWVTVVTATGVYGGTIVFSRLFGQRQFSTLTTYDLPFVFALGSVIGRVVLVRVSLLGAVLGLLVLFVLHAATGWLHHNFGVFHRLTENQPILLVADGRVLEDNLRRAHASRVEVHEKIRLAGAASLEEVRAVIIERTGAMSVISSSEELDPELFADVFGVEQLG